MAETTLRKTETDGSAVVSEPTAKKEESNGVAASAGTVEQTVQNEEETKAAVEQTVKSWADGAENGQDGATSSSSAPAATSQEEKTEPSEEVQEVQEKLELLGELSLSEEPALLDDPDEANIQAVTPGDTVYTSAVTFEDLNLSEELLRGLYVEMGFSRPSKIQAVTLPMILTPPYKDLVAQAHNGSGKTTCFVLGMLSRVDPKKKIPQAICICPTRELALQNQAVLLRMGKFTGISCMCAIQDETSSYVPMAKRAPITDQVVIGTPGTIKKWLKSKKLATREIKIIVFDEADHMLAEEGFRDDSERILKDIQEISASCFQVLLFSATFNDMVKAFIPKVVQNANQLYVKKEELSLEKLKQYKVWCPDELAKIEVIRDRIFEFGQKVGQTIIFVRTKESTKMLQSALTKEGYECSAIQGALKQEDRDKIIQEFRDGLTKVLITTDLLARGFDQAQVNMVINYDLPIKYGTGEPNYEVYLHRIGRAGRFGRKGAVFNLMMTDWDKITLEKIENHFQHSIPEVSDWKSEEDFENALKVAGLL